MDESDSFCGGSQLLDDHLLLNNTFPEFTDCFQNTLLVWIPCGFLWITAPYYLYYLLSNTGASRPHSYLNISKTFISGSLFILALVDIFKSASDHKVHPTSTALYLASSIKLLSYLLTVIEIQLERLRGFVTSGILFIFWFTSLMCSIIPFYTYIMKEVYDDDLFKFCLFLLYFLLLTIQFVLHCIAEKIPEKSKYNIGVNPCPEVTASFLSRITFWWLNSLIITGYRKDLEETDISELHPRDKSDEVVRKFEKVWKKELSKCAVTVPASIQTASTTTTPTTDVKRRAMQRQEHIQEETPFLGSEDETDVMIKKGKTAEKTKNKASLVKVLCLVYGADLFKSWGCKMVYDFLQFVSPILLNAMIGYTNKKSAGHPEAVWKGYVLAAGFFVVAILQSTFFHQNFHISMTAGMRARSALIAAVFKKSLTMNNESKKSSTIGEIVNLMSVDCQRLQDMSGQLWMIWSAPLQILLATVLLWQQLGPSVLAGLAVMFLLIPVNVIISIKQRTLQTQLMRYKDSRLKLMNEILNGMKVLKLYAWEPAFQEKVTDIRKKELDVLRKYAYLNAFSTFSFTCAPFLVTLATFATYIMSSTENYLDAQKAFVSLSLFNILRFPINLLPMMISFIIQTSVSIKRLSTFLKNGDLDPNNVQHDEITGTSIQVENGTFTWDSGAPPALKSINLKVSEGELIAVVGTVGSGKSSLISALLGEMDKLQGKVNVKGKIAYVPQQAWMQNATVKDNILFGREMNLGKYDEVIEACALKRDFEILTGGDMTEIGEKGINLSGGQKQRISLARAVYNNADIYFLDDPLSAVDSHVGKHMFKSVVGKKGLLKNKTRILVTHGIHWLPMVDTVVVLVDGRISEIGSYEELLSHEGAFAQFLNSYFTEEVKDEDEEEELENDPEVLEEKCRILERLQSVTTDKCWFDKKEKSSLRRAEKIQKKAKLVRTISMIDQSALPVPEGKIKPAKSVEKLIEKEKQGQGKIEWKVFLSYFKAVGIPAMCAIFLLFMVFQGTSIASNIWLSLWSDDKFLANRSLANTTEYSQKNSLYLGVYGGLGVVQAVIILIYSLLGTISYVKAATQLHQGMLNNIMKAPMSFFDTTPSGRIVNRFSGDVQTIDVTLPMTFRMWISIFFQTLSTIIVISYSTPIFLSVIVPLGIFYYFIQRFYVPSSRQLQRLESTSKSPIYNHFSETLTGAQSLRAYKAQERFIQESLYRVDKNISFYFTRIASQRWLGFRLEFVGNLIVFAAALFAVLTPGIEGGVVGLSISYALQITGALNMFVRTTSDLETNVVSVERVKEYAEVEGEAEWINPNKRPPDDWPANGECKFDSYKTRYREGLDLVLKGITCDIAGGEKVGIVGRTGAGKSSLTMALFRLIESADGKIIIDNQCIADMGLHDLRQKLTILPQDPVLFSGSLRMNLDPISQYNDDQIWKSLEHAHLKTYVDGLADKLDYECGEGGQNLSVGQRQLVCLGRSLLHKTKILILDEATAAVDMETDELIQKTIRSEFKECTILTIAHRLNTIMDYDKVMVLDQGLIAEFDSPNSLLEKKSSIFYGMAKAANIVS